MHKRKCLLGLLLLTGLAPNLGASSSAAAVTRAQCDAAFFTVNTIPWDSWLCTMVAEWYNENC